MKKYAKIFTAIITVLAVAGCSQSGITGDAGGSSDDIGTVAGAGNTGSGGSLISGDTSDAGVSDADTPSSSEFKGTDIGGKKEPFLNKEFYDAGMFIDEAPAAEGGEAAPSDDCVIDPGFSVDPDFPIEPAIPPQSGLLTGGEWDDNEHWADWRALYSSHGDWKNYKSVWETADDYRLTVTVTSNGKPLEGAAVKWEADISAVTDNKGKAYLFSDELLFEVTTTYGETGQTANVDWVLDEHDLTFSVALDDAVSPAAQKLDLMIMCDTTGSMGDELEYLKVELEDIVGRIKTENANIPTRVSVNFYRDTEDEYEVRQFPFSENIDEVAEALRGQSAHGGGDFPEAVHTALDSAVNKHDWAEDSVKILFLVLDAPPHDDAQIIDSVNEYIDKAASMGIRIVPIASSGIDKSTEYLLRTMAFRTGGTYTFLTDDSGVGNSHIEPTVGAYNVERLNDMIVRIVNGYLAE